MKTISMLILNLFFVFSGMYSQSLKPYILAYETDASVSTVKNELKSELQSQGLEVIGDYRPAADENRWILIFSSSELKNAVNKIGGLTGFAAALRIGITRENGKTVVSYTDPIYWGNAYFRDDFDKVASNYDQLAGKLTTIMQSHNGFQGTSFGSKKGVSAKELRKYHYMIGMPYFYNTVELASFNSYAEAKNEIDKNLRLGVKNVKQLYKLELPGKDLCLYGFALSGDDGEGQFLPIIDISNPKHTAFLPYEILVVNGEVHMLHGRYRIALSFPDLTMGTFTKIMSTPGNIEDLLKQVAL